MFSFLTDNVSKYATTVRSALKIIGGAAVGFAVASQVDVDTVVSNYDVIVEAVKAVITSVTGIVGAATAIAGVVASIKAKKAAK